jgi:hypothetical protein
MKIKDLIGFNPEAEISLLGLDYMEIPLDLYGWVTNDDSDDPNNDTKLNTPCIHLVPKGLSNNYNRMAEA